MLSVGLSAPAKKVNNEGKKKIESKNERKKKHSNDMIHQIWMILLIKCGAMMPRYGYSYGHGYGNHAIQL